MLFYILLALFNGFIIGLNRAINGKLSDYIGAFQASFINHFVGFLFLSLLYLCFYNFQIPNLSNTSFYVYLGGFCGVFMVALSSYTFIKLGATKSLIYAISAQMITCVLIDSGDLYSFKFLGRLLGVGFIVFGIYMQQARKEKMLIAQNKV